MCPGNRKLVTANFAERDATSFPGSLVLPPPGNEVERDVPKPGAGAGRVPLTETKPWCNFLITCLGVDIHRY